MRTLYTMDDQYTKEAEELEKEIYDTFLPIFKKWTKAGYSIRIISHIAMNACWGAELDAIIGED